MSMCSRAVFPQLGLRVFALFTCFCSDVSEGAAELERRLDISPRCVNFKSIRCSFCCVWLLCNLLDIHKGFFFHLFF